MVRGVFVDGHAMADEMNSCLTLASSTPFIVIFWLVCFSSYHYQEYDSQQFKVLAEGILVFQKSLF